MNLEESLNRDNGIILSLDNGDILEKVWNYAGSNGKSLAIALDNSSDRIKTIIRHDPDIVYMRTLNDANEARMAFRCANCGHLVVAKVKSKNLYDLENEKKSWDIKCFDDLLLTVC